MVITPAGFVATLAAPVDDDSIAHVFVGDRLVLPVGEEAGMRTARDYQRAGLTGSRTHVLGTYDGRTHVAIALDADSETGAQIQVPEGWRAAGLRSYFGELADPHLGIAMRAVQVLEWDRTHRFCGNCGHPTERVATERARRCGNCGLTAYPRISPAMMVLIVRDRQLLLGRGVNFPAGRYSALAGFLEAGETIEECIHREVREEVGVSVTDLRYFASQSWPFPNSLMLAFTARWAGGDIEIDPAEIADAQYFDIDALPAVPPRLSVARALIDATVAQMRAGTY